jgi:hypothetical protein
MQSAITLIAAMMGWGAHTQHIHSAAKPIVAATVAHTTAMLRLRAED